LVKVVSLLLSDLQQQQVHSPLHLRHLRLDHHLPPSQHLALRPPQPRAQGSVNQHSVNQRNLLRRQLSVQARHQLPILSANQPRQQALLAALVNLPILLPRLLDPLHLHPPRERRPVSVHHLKPNLVEPLGRHPRSVKHPLHLGREGLQQVSASVHPLQELGLGLKRAWKYQKDGRGMIRGVACYPQWLVEAKEGSWNMSW